MAKTHPGQQDHLFPVDVPPTPHADGTYKRLPPDEDDVLLGKGTGSEWPAGQAIARHALKAVTLKEPSTPNNETHPHSFDFTALETDIIGFTFEAFSNGTLWLCVYDKRTGDEKTGRILDSMKVETKAVTTDQCRELIQSVEILLSQRQQAA